MTVSRNDPRETQADDSPARTVRVFEAGGLRWTVREVPYPPTDRRSGTCLIFDAGTVIRRVRNFPLHWDTLADDELYTLSLSA